MLVSGEAGSDPGPAMSDLKRSRWLVLVCELSLCGLGASPLLDMSVGSNFSLRLTFSSSLFRGDDDRRRQVHPFAIIDLEVCFCELTLSCRHWCTCAFL